MLNHMKRWMIVMAFVAAACSKNSPTAPTQSPPPVVPSCQTNNTASIAFENKFPSTTLDIVWDGAKIVTLTPGATSSPFTFAAGVAHTLRFQITNTTQLACTQIAPVLTMCGTGTYFCPS